MKGENIWMYSAQYLAHEKCSVDVSQCIVVLLLLQGRWKESQGSFRFEGPFKQGSAGRIGFPKWPWHLKQSVLHTSRVSGNPG